MKFLVIVLMLTCVHTAYGRDEIPTKIIENNPLQYEHFISTNLFLDARFGILIPADIPISVSNPSIFGPNMGIGFSYRFRPDFPVGFMFDADVSPLDFSLLMHEKKSVFKAWDFLVSAGLLIQVYDN
ncbi:MAG TPA: hypothetical protein VJ946_12565, partial [Bacteroidales bacterium]|nr:hypothetical protein [Bacteroidales bacterium]